MSRLSVQIVMAFMGVSTDKVWDMLQNGHDGLLSGSAKCILSGTECALDGVKACLQKVELGHFGITVNDMEFHYSHIRKFDHSLVWIRRAVQDSDDAWLWIRPFASTTAFRQAWIYDDEYNYWQNAQNPLEYTAKGKSCAGLTLKSNGLPPPLEQMVIDTSENPGRRVLRHGYVETVASVMWLGNQFWNVTGIDKKQVLDNGLVRAHVINDDVIRLQCHALPFSTAAGDSGTIQEKLRSLLFPVPKMDGR